MKSLNLILAFVLLSGVAAKSQDPCVDRKWKTPYKTSWIANDGGNQAKHAQHSIEYLSVRADGMVATSCGWDESGSNVIVYKNGQVVSVPEGSGTGGWGRMSMGQAAMDDKYVYHLQSQNGCDGANTSNNSNKLPQYPQCGDDFTWKTVRRYAITNGMSAPFSSGYGYKGDMLLVHAGTGDLSGIAIKGNELFVADANGDSVKVYNKTTMSTKPLRKFKMAGGVGQLAVDNQGCLWMFQQKLQKLIRFSATTGEIQAQQIVFKDPMVASTFSVDTVGNRILVADNGIDQNIKIYSDIYTSPVQSSTFGTQFGILSGVQGKFEDQKLFDIKGVGSDAAGNIYVASSPNGSGSLLAAYSPDGTKLWDRKGLVFTSTACADPQKLEDVYTFDKKMILDYSKTAPGSEWSFAAYTVNRFKYPDDPRCNNIKDPLRPNIFWTSSWIKYIGGKKFLFATDMYASVLAGFRFDEATDGEVAIPCLLMNVGGWDLKLSYPVKLGSEKDFIWMDLNGDGAIQSNEFTYKSGFDNPYSMAIWVDSKGDIWKGIRGNGVRYIPLKEVNAKGVPVYDFATSKRLDIANAATGVDGVKRLVYDADLDELYISGFSTEKPDRKSTGEGVDSWWCMGSTVCKYKNVLATLKANPNTNFKNVLPEWRIFVPFFPDGDPAGSTAVSAKSLTVEGDILFIATAQEGKINVYKRSNGEYLGQIAPGAAINSESGWTDIDYAINVNKTPTEYRIFIEENAFAKVVLYRMPGFETTDTYYPDLTITDVKMENAQNQTVEKPKLGDKLHFSMTVKNTGPGLSPAGKTFADKKSITLTISVKDLETNKVVGTFASDTCTLSLESGQSLKLVNFSTTKAFEWNVPTGKFAITVVVNPSKKIKECNAANNTFILNTNSFDRVHFSSNPKDASIQVNGTTVFETEALGNEPIDYKWFVNDVEQSGINSPILSLTGVGSNLNLAKIKVTACNSLGCETSKEAVLKVSDPYGSSKPGFLVRQVWYGNTGTAIADLRKLPDFPNNPDSITYINRFEVPKDIADQYGTRVFGWLTAPETGNYIFNIASDDNGELWLSSDSLPKNLGILPIAKVPEWSDSRQYTKFPEQTSNAIALIAGKKYYVEALFKEDAGGDNLSVAWKLPSGITENPIPASRIGYYANISTSAQTISNGIGGELSIYPVPASEKIRIKSPKINGIVSYTITDMNGKILIKRSMNLRGTVEQDISSLPAGIYFVNIADGTVAYHGKFVVVK
jgi:hypothetical protein